MAIEDSTAARPSGAEARPSPAAPSKYVDPRNPFSDPDIFLRKIAPPEKPARPALPPDLRPRQITMGGSSYYDAEGESVPVPYLRLMGKWLDRAGFPIGVNLRVTVEMGRLVIEPAPPEYHAEPSTTYTRKRLLK